MLVAYYYVTSHLKTNWLKMTIITYCISQFVWIIQIEHSWDSLTLLHYVWGLYWKTWSLGARRLDQGCRVHFQDGSHMFGMLVLAVSRRPQFLCTWPFPEDCLSVLTTWQLAYSRKKHSRAIGKRFNAFYGLTSEVTYCLFQAILLVMWFSSGSLREGTIQGHEHQK